MNRFVLSALNYELKLNKFIEKSDKSWTKSYFCESRPLLNSGNRMNVTQKKVPFQILIEYIFLKEMSFCYRHLRLTKVIFWVKFGVWRTSFMFLLLRTKRKTSFRGKNGAIRLGWFLLCLSSENDSVCKLRNDCRGWG